MTFRVLQPSVLPALLSLFLLLQYAPCLADPTPQVKVKRVRGNLIVDASMVVPVRQQLAFEVLTDYSHMPTFVSNLKESKILESNGNKLVVSQKGKAGSGAFSISWETTREITLTAPTEIHSKIIAGSVKQGESTTRLSQEGHNIKIVMHSESAASALLPPLIGVSMVETQIKKQYGELRDEMLKRQKLAEP